MDSPISTDGGEAKSQFLILCLQSRFHPSALDQARRLAAYASFDWLALGDLISEERLAPLLYAIGKDFDIFPAQLEIDMRETYLHNGIRNALLLKELAQVIAHCAAAEIELLILKGAALAEMVYHNIAVRPMVDLDILVREADVEETIQQLAAIGYEALDAETHPGSLLSYENELTLCKRGQIDVTLELHWSLLDSPHYQRVIDMDWFWQTAVPAEFSGRAGMTLGAEALLLHLCAHIMLHHQGQGLLWLHDVAEVLVRFSGRLNWEMLLQKGRDYDLVLSLKAILNKVCLLWDIALPSGILARINASQPSSRERQIFSWLTSPERPVAQRFWADLASSKDWSRRLTFAWQNLFPSADYMRRRYAISHSLLLPFYYPYRWLLGLTSIFRR